MERDGWDRPRPPLAGDERETLEGWLDFHRATLLMKCEGLSDEQLKRQAVPPSALSLLGLVRHMIEVDRSWFGELAGDYPGPVFCTDDVDADWNGVAEADARADLATFRSEIERATRVVRGVGLDVTQTDGEGERSLRWIYTHMIEEYARHNGHADLLREVIDGSVGA